MRRTDNDDPRAADGWNKCSQGYPIAMATRSKPTHPMPPLESHPWGRDLVAHEAERQVLRNGTAAPVPEVLQ